MEEYRTFPFWVTINNVQYQILDREKKYNEYTDKTEVSYILYGEDNTLCKGSQTIVEQWECDKITGDPYKVKYESPIEIKVIKRNVKIYENR